MIDTIYRLSLWRYGDFKIEGFEVVKKTKKTVIIKVYHNVGDGFREAYCETRYNLKSKEYVFYDTLKEAKHSAENVIANRLAYYNTRVDEIRARLQEVCKHKAITGPSLGNKCVRCDFRVLNPEEYTSGGG